MKWNQFVQNIIECQRGSSHLNRLYTVTQGCGQKVAQPFLSWTHRQCIETQTQRQWTIHSMPVCILACPSKPAQKHPLQTHRETSLLLLSLPFLLLYHFKMTLPWGLDFVPRTVFHSSTRLQELSDSLRAENHLTSLIIITGES